MNKFAEEFDSRWMEKCLEIHSDISRELVKNFGFDHYYPLVSKSSKIKHIFNLIKKVAKSNSSVLIQGETGVGKELIADLIQFISYRNTRAYVKVNCAALPDNLLESELFGHEKGAFTGAFQRRIGKFEQAHSGTIFLDEIGDMNPMTQAKILRVMQDKEFTRVGGNNLVEVDVRIITASNKDLEQQIELGNFRNDLYYRLNVITIDVPPLRQRKEDILLIADFFRKKFSKELQKPTRGFTDETKTLLINHSWPGNIRELKNLIERAVLMVDEGDAIDCDDLALSGKDYFLAGGKERRKNNESNGAPTTLDLKQLEKQHIIKALEITRWVQKDAADLLGISNRSLNYKIKYHGITHPAWKKNR
ncbi:MAG TPA: sigma-54-dependent Fis family transcriptional regulator [bacterium]|nr:sigma-54-dependent Fis family transcriptional regulator [bacterium]